MSNVDLEPLILWYETLTPASLERLPDFYTDDAYFKDPFQEFRSRERLRRVYAHMFETLEAPRFAIINTLREGHQAMLVWNMSFSLDGKPMRIHGSTHLMFGADGRINYHRDYWDAAEELYEKLPVLGWLLRQVKKKLQAEGK